MLPLSRVCKPFVLAGFAALSLHAVSAYAQVDHFGSGTGSASINDKTLSSPTPFFPLTVSSSTGYSETSAFLSAREIEAEFSQYTSGLDQTSGSLSVNFTVKDGTTYSVSDQAPTYLGNAAFDGYVWHLELKDVTTGTDLFYDNSGDITGSLTGVLLASDSYEFSAGTSMYPLLDPQLVYTPSVLFSAASVPAATPEPSSLVLLCTGLTGLAAGFRRRFHA